MSGKEPEGKKDWRKVDERLINLGMKMVEVIRGFLVINKSAFQKELDEMNRGKKGHPFRCPRSIILLLAGLNTILPFRQLSGILIGLFDMKYHYTAIQKRVKKEMAMWEYRETKGGLIFFRRNIPVATYFIDSSGFSVWRKGVWRITKFKIKVKRVWYKLHIISNENGDIVTFAVTGANVSDSLMFRELALVIPPGSTIYGDKGYFSRANYKFAKERGLIFHAPPKSNAVARAKGVRENVIR